MDSLKIRFLDFKDFFSLSTNTIKANIGILLKIFLVGIGITITSIIAENVITTNIANINIYQSIMFIIFTLLNSILYIFVIITCILMVRCKFSKTDLNFTIIFDYFKNNIFSMMFISFIRIFFYIIIPVVYVYIHLSNGSIYDLLKLTFTIPLLVYLLVAVYISTRCNFAFFLVFLYDIDAKEAYYLSYKITKNNFLKLLLLSMCLTFFVCVCSLFFGFNFGVVWGLITGILEVVFKNHLIYTILTSIPAIVYQICSLVMFTLVGTFQALMALNLVLIKDNF